MDRMSGGVGFATRERLKLACDRYGIRLDEQHRAFADARATAELLRRALGSDLLGVPASINSSQWELNPRTHRRDATGGVNRSELSRVVSRVTYPATSEEVMSYLDMLDWALDDLVITDVERAEIGASAQQLGLTDDQVC